MTKKGNKLESLSDLGFDNLYRVAIEEFALPLGEKEEENEASILAAFAEAGFRLDDYLEQHPELQPEGWRKKDKTGANVVTAKAQKKEEVVSPDEIVVAAPLVQKNAKYLIKMVRENVRYDTRGYTFTQEHPYALLDKDDAQFVLENEKGFRQATPSELEEFYS